MSSAQSESTREGGFPWSGMIVLASAAFFSVTAETLPTGLLPDMASSLHVTQPQVGLLVTIFAFTVVVSGVPLTALTRRIPRHALLVVVIALLGVGCLLTAFAPNYAVIVVARVLGGMAQGLFWSVVGAYSGYLVPQHLVARAVSITQGGTSLALVLGAPLATIAGHALGWRVAFGAVGIFTIAGALLVWWLLPPVQRDVDGGRAAASVGDGRTGSGSGTPARTRDATIVPVLLLCGLVCIVTLGHFAMYTYVAPFVSDAMGFGNDSIGPMLVVYGAGGAVGVVLVGVLLGKNPTRGITFALLFTAVAVTLLGIFSGQPMIAVIAFVLWAIGFGTLPSLLQTQLLHLSSPRFRDTASSLFTTGFNIGIGGGALVGGIIFGRSGVDALPWFDLVAIAAALVLSFVTARLAGRTRNLA